MPIETIVFIAICLLTGLCTFIVARPAKPKENKVKKEEAAAQPQMLVGGGGNLTCEHKNQLVEIDQTVCIYQAEVRLLRAGRGEEAYQVLHQTNAYNARPPQGKEYLIALLEITVKNVRAGTGPVSVSPLDACCRRYSGAAYDRKNIITPRPSLRGNLQPGMLLTGWVAFEIDQNDPCPQLVFGQDFEGNGGARFALVPALETAGT